MSDCLFVEACDFISYPPGGQLAFARQMMAAFGNRLALVGISTGQTPTGRWIKKRIEGIEYDFFPIGNRNPVAKKPLIPLRFSAFLQLKLNKYRILRRGYQKIFYNSPEVALAMAGWGFKHSCFCLHGLNNPLALSRFRIGKLFSPFYEPILIKLIKDIDVILACADQIEVSNFTTKNRLKNTHVIPFPTRVDPSIFKPCDLNKSRSELGIVIREPVFVVSGRLNKYKGWQFILSAFSLFAKKNGGQLIFIGDGEDRPLLETEIELLGLKERVKVTGFVLPSEVARYLNAADVYIVGSLKEGWSVAMLEALACGRPIVTTEVSGAQDMVREGENGFIIRRRDPNAFAIAMRKALNLPRAHEISINIAQKYSLETLKADLERVWPAIR